FSTGVHRTSSSCATRSETSTYRISRRIPSRRFPSSSSFTSGSRSRPGPQEWSRSLCTRGGSTQKRRGPQSMRPSRRPDCLRTILSALDLAVYWMQSCLVSVVYKTDVAAARLSRLADLIVDYSLELQSGQVFRIDALDAASPLTLAFYRSAIRGGACPYFCVRPEARHTLLS